MGKVDLAGAFTKAWDGLGLSVLDMPMLIIGVLILAFVLIGYGIRRSKEHGGKPPWWGIALGAALISPTVLLPFILTMLSAVINIAITLLDKFFEFL